jgi:hypothetical protein
VNGKAHDTSDLDLVVIKDEKIPISELNNFKDSLRFSNILKNYEVFLSIR